MTERAHQRNKRRNSGLLVTSLFVSIILLFLIALTGWARFGFEHTLKELQVLLIKNNQLVKSLNTPFALSLDFSQIQSVLAREGQAFSNDLEAMSSELVGDSVVSSLKSDAGFYLNEVASIMSKAWSLFGLVFKIILAKCLILISALPLFLLFGLLGLVDGLSLREIRTAELGRESSYLFHLLNKWVLRAVLLVLCAWLALPVAITPQYVLLPLSLLLAMMVSMTASRFKKYL